MTANRRADRSGDRAEILTISRLARYLERACTDLTLAQYRVLALVADGERRASRVAGTLALTKPTVSATVDVLAARGLVSRTAADDDRRVMELAVAAAGRRALHSTEAAMRERLHDLLEPSDVDVVADALARVRTALDARRAQRHAARAGGVDGDSRAGQ